ncbi:winged helix-turn-helix domain-containing protein, partial [Haloactinopolyspora alba]|uniref:winged helix-turn-helix domain-containing protein n=1 Tax=Haloactinopolyspora alba TaxID=648780 RepID=UPI00197A8B6A
APPRSGPPSVSVGGVTLDVPNRRVTMPSGAQAGLTPLQAAVLAHLMSRSGRVCSRAELMCQAMGYPVPVGSRTVDVHVATLRTKLGGALRIRSVRGVGYTLEPSAGS